MDNVEDKLVLADKNLVFSIKNRMKNLKDSVFYETKDYIIFSIGIDSVDGHLNGGICLNDEKADEFMNKLEDVFKNLNRGYAIWIRDHNNKKLESILKNKGLTPVREPGTRCMICEDRIKEVKVPEGFTLERITTDKHIEDLKSVVKESFDKNNEVSDIMFNLEMLNNPNSEGIIAYENASKTPVSVATMVISEGVSGIYYVGTLSDYRGKGLGALVAERATNLGFDKGSKLSILQASELGEKVYNKLSYKGISYYRIYRVESNKTN